MCWLDNNFTYVYVYDMLLVYISSKKNYYHINPMEKQIDNDKERERKWEEVKGSLQLQGKVCIDIEQEECQWGHWKI